MKGLCYLSSDGLNNKSSILFTGPCNLGKTAARTADKRRPAGHGFNCDERPDFKPESAALALERSLAFFARHLG